MVWDTIGAFGLGAIGPYQGIGFRADLRFKLYGPKVILGQAISVSLGFLVFLEETSV